MKKKALVRLNGYEKKQLAAVEGWILEHLSEPLTLAMAAQTAGISVYKFKASFTQTYGLRFIDYLKAKRMQKAAALLVETNDLVATVGQVCGYQNEASFQRAFKRWSGQSPRDFRKG